jgi:PAS domain S-box-containing protein
VELQDSSLVRMLLYAGSFRQRLMAWSRAIVSANAARVVATPMIVASSLAMLGYLTGFRPLVQPIPTFPPMEIESVLGVFVLGIGILLSSYPRLREASTASAVLVFCIGLISAVEGRGMNSFGALLSRIPLTAGLPWNGPAAVPMALSSAIYILLGSLGLLAILSRPRGLWSSITLAASGGIVMLLAATVIAAQLIGVLEGMTSGPFLGSSLQSSLCAIVFATYFNALVWTRQSGFSPPPAWLPLSVGAGSLAGVIFVWRALIGSEESRLADQSRVAALTTQSAVTRELMVAQRNLRRMARHSRAADTTWQSSVTQMIADVPGLESVIWADSAGHPRAADHRTSPAALAEVERTLRPYAGDFRQERQWAAFIPVPENPSLALMVQPRCRAASCTDLFVGVIDARSVLGAILADTVLGFEMGIGNGHSWLRTTAPLIEQTRHYLVTQSIVRGGPEWQIGVWPSARVAAATPSRLSDLVLLLGIAVSVLLAIALRLAQTVSQTARLEERAKLDLALQSTTDGIWEWDIPTGDVTRSAQLWLHLGYGTGEAYASLEDWLSLIHPQDRAVMETRLGDHLAQRTESYEAQYRVRSADGRWHEIVERGRVVMRASDGTPLHVIGMFADVTDRRNAEESVRQAETMSTMGRLAARIAHEINNPLAGIQNSFLLIKDAIPPTHPHIKYVGAIEREVQRISQVTRQLYETYRPETESTSQAPIQTVVGDAVAFIQQVNRATGVHVQVELGGIAAVVKLSDAMLRQCVYNLVQNAIEASPPGSLVLVRGAIDGDKFVLSVVDQGPGVPVESRERIFDPFVSTKPSKLSSGGMGMGLSLVRRALNAAGGSIQVTDAAGGGAEFIARIPLVETSVRGAMA